MPKEATHLYLSRLAREAASRNTGLKEISGIWNQAPHSFAMGSAAPDSVYNYIKGPAKIFFRMHIEHSHSGGDDLFQFLPRFAEQNLTFIPALSFGLGILCHLTADMIFHPVVFHFCGDDDEASSSNSIVRHYRFESSLDSFIRWYKPEQKKVLLSRHLKNKELSDSEFSRALEALHLPKDAAAMVPEKEFLSMYRQHALFDSFYGKGFFMELARLINKFTGGAKPEIQALFYKDRSGYVTENTAQKILNTCFEYQNPVTGGKMQKSLNILIEDCLSLFFDYLNPLEDALASIRPSSGNEECWETVLPVIEKWLRRSPKTGLPVQQNGPMQFFRFLTFENLFS